MEKDLRSLCRKRTVIARAFPDPAPMNPVGHAYRTHHSLEAMEMADDSWFCCDRSSPPGEVDGVSPGLDSSFLSSPDSFLIRRLLVALLRLLLIVFARLVLLILLLLLLIFLLILFRLLLLILVVLLGIVFLVFLRFR